MLHVVQREKHDNIPMALINLDEDEKIFLKKGEILGYLEPSPIEITEIVKEECNKVSEIDEKEDESYTPGEEIYNFSSRGKYS